MWRSPALIIIVVIYVVVTKQFVYRQDVVLVGRTLDDSFYLCTLLIHTIYVEGTEGTEEITR